jgi:hypothetical protein
LTIESNAAALAVRLAWRRSRAGRSVRSIAIAAASCIAVGIASFDDWPALTWSLGWTGAPSRALARWAITSFAFMFVDVPEPVW